MKKSRKLAVLFAGASMVVSLSAFAETRHRDATNDEGRVRREERADGNAQRHDDQARVQPQENRSDRSNRSERRDESYRNDTNNRRNEHRSDSDRRDESRDRNYDRRNNESDRNGRDSRNNGSYRNDGSHRNNDRSYGRNGHDSYRYDGRRSYSTHGRVTRYEPYRGGYRIWVGGGYPFFVTDAWFHLHRIRLGIDVALGGYWNRGGYYDAYDGIYDTRGEVRGVVESVDYRRGTAVVRDDLSGSFITIVLRGYDRGLGDLRPGDYVTLGGEWSRNGVFNAYDLLDLDSRYGGRY